MDLGFSTKDMFDACVSACVLIEEAKDWLVEAY